MIATVIYQTAEFDNPENDDLISNNLGLPLLNYQSRRDLLVEFLTEHEFSEHAYTAWVAERMRQQREDEEKEQCFECEEVKQPSMADQAKSFTSAAVQHAKSGFKNVDKATLAERNRICESCGLLGTDGKMKDRCQVCGCYMKIKARWATSKCPKGKWLSIK
jgi:hypothetical protein